MIYSSVWAREASVGMPSKDYLLRCSGCHGVQGFGNEAAGVPDLRGKLNRFLAVEGGREFLVQVPGVSQSPLNDSDLANMLNWLIDEMDEDGHSQQHIPYTQEEIRRIRAAPIANVMERRRELIKAITEQSNSGAKREIDKAARGDQPHSQSR